MSRVTKRMYRNAGINAIQNAGTMISSIDIFSELTVYELEESQRLGRIMVKHPEKVLSLLNRLEKADIKNREVEI